MGVDLARSCESAVEALGNLARAVRVARKQDQRGKVADLGADMNLWHAR
jgi:hypothetical protein